MVGRMDFGVVNLLRPSKVDDYIKKALFRASWDLTLTNVLIAVIIMVFASLTMILLGALFPGPLSGILGDVGLEMVKGRFDFVILGIGVAGVVAGFFVAGLILHMIAKALGGKGTAEQLLYLMSGILLLFTPVLAIMVLFSVVPCAGLLVLPLPLLIFAYSMYLYHRVVMAAYKLESGRAIIVLFVWLSAVLTLSAMLSVLLFFFGIELISKFLPPLFSSIGIIFLFIMGDTLRNQR